MKLKYFLVCVLLFTVLKINAQQTNFPFVPNVGQWQNPFEFKADLKDFHIFGMKNNIRFLLDDKTNSDKIHDYHHGFITDMTLKYHAIDMQFVNSNTPQIVLNDESKYYFNYFIGSDSSHWKSNVKSYHQAKYQNVWNGIHLHWYPQDKNIKYDWIVDPGADANQIKLKFDGVDKCKKSFGQLVLKTSVGDYTESEPIAYQLINGKKEFVECQWYLENGHVTFDFPKGYNHDYTLVIDPTLTFSTLSGSFSDNWGMSATYDNQGNFYLGSLTTGSQFPLTTGAFQSTFGGGTFVNNFPSDVTLSKYNPTGSSLIYGTYIGGNGDEFPHSLIVNGQDLVVCGRTSSANYPTTAGSYDVSHNGGLDFFITKFNATGTALLGSTFLGGSGDDGTNVSNIEMQYGPTQHLKFNYGDESRSEVNIDVWGNIFIAGSTQSSNFPFSYSTASTKNLQNSLVAKFNSSLSTLIWCGNYGGNNFDAAYVLDFDKNYNFVYAAGGTESNNLSMNSIPIQSSYGGSIDGFISKIDITNGQMLTTTYLGTSSYDQIYGIQVDDSNNVYVTGQTRGTWPIVGSVYSNPGSAHFIQKLDPTLTTTLFSTVYGNGSHNLVNISPVAFLVDTCGNIFVSGWGGQVNNLIANSQAGYTTGMPVTANAIKSTTDGSDFYFIVLSKNAATLRYASFFGQNNGGGEHVDGGTSRFSPTGQIYQAICANCSSNGIVFPTTAGAYSSANNSNNCNAAAVKIDFEYTAAIASAQANPDTSGCVPFTVVFNNTSQNSTSYFWNFGDGNTSTSAAPTHIYTTPGIFHPYLAVYNPLACIERDTTFLNILVKSDSIKGTFNFVALDSCTFASLTFGQTVSTSNPTLGPGFVYTWNFGDGTSFSGANPPPHKYLTQGNYTITLTVTHPKACNNPLVITKTFTFSNSSVDGIAMIPDSLCLPQPLTVTNTSINATSYFWDFGDGTTSTLASPTHNYTAAGNYTVIFIAINAATCNKADTIKKIVHCNMQPKAIFTVTPFPLVINQPIFTSNSSLLATSYLWEFGDGATSTAFEPSYLYKKSGTYDICLTAINGFCKDKMCKTLSVEIKPIIDITTGFTPNGDDINDYVEVNGYGVESFNLKIFNRWGEMVYNQEHTTVGKTWNGQFRNTLQEQEVYAYILDAKFVDGSTELKKGNLTLVKII